MTETIHFEGISLPVSDVERSIAFYQQFGFKLQIQNANFALLKLGEGTIGLLKMDLSKWPSAPRGAIHIELSIENLDMLYEQFEAQGVVLFICSLLLMPGQTFFAIGIEVLLIGLSDWVIISFLQLHSLHKMESQYRLQFVPYIVLGQSAALSFVIAGIVLLIYGTGGLYWIVAATLLSFVAAFTAAWILLIEINR